MFIIFYVFEIWIKFLKENLTKTIISLFGVPFSEVHEIPSITPERGPEPESERILTETTFVFLAAPYNFPAIVPATIDLKLLEMKKSQPFYSRKN